MSFQELVDKDRRLVILRVLAESDKYRTNSSILKTAIRDLAGHDVGRDIVEADLDHLRQHRLVNVETINAPSGGNVVIATLTELGLDVAQGRPHPEVRRPSPGS